MMIYSIYILYTIIDLKNVTSEEMLSVCENLGSLLGHGIKVTNIGWKRSRKKI